MELILLPKKGGDLLAAKDLKCGFYLDCGFGRNMEKRSKAEIAFHITTKTRFGQLKNLSNEAILP